MKGHSLGISSFSILFYFFCLIIAIFVGLALLDGEITRADILDYLAATIGAISLSATFALAVLAINAYANMKEVEDLKQRAIDLQDSLSKEVENTRRMLSVMPAVISHITIMLPEQLDEDQIDSGERDVAYFQLLHSRLYMKLIAASDHMDRLDICRDIIGSMDRSSSRLIMEACIDELVDILKLDSSLKDLIVPLQIEANKILQQMSPSEN